MKNPPIEYPGVAGKVVEKVLLLHQKATNGEPCIEIRFTDKTSLYFELYPRVTLAPELMSWKKNEGRTLRRYPEVLTSKST
jgi:hypothetical protein